MPSAWLSLLSELSILLFRTKSSCYRSRSIFVRSKRSKILISLYRSLFIPCSACAFVYGRPQGIIESREENRTIVEESAREAFVFVFFALEIMLRYIERNARKSHGKRIVLRTIESRFETQTTWRQVRGMDIKRFTLFSELRNFLLHFHFLLSIDRLVSQQLDEFVKFYSNKWCRSESKGNR